MKIWSDNEVKMLFAKVEQCRQQHESLIRAFADHARAFSRKPNSVRNYYYHEVDNLSEDKVRAARLRIDMTKHCKAHFKNFDKVQEGELFEKIDTMTANGISVRSACMKLSGGNLGLMTRYQNKYQNMKRKLQNTGKFEKKQSKSAQPQEKLVLRELKKLKDIQKNGNIIPFKIPQILSDNDINSLFLGLVRLIKKSAQDEALRINENRENEFEKLQLKFDSLKKQNKSLQTKIDEFAKKNKQLALKTQLGNKLHKENLESTKRG